MPPDARAASEANPPQTFKLNLLDALPFGAIVTDSALQVEHLNVWLQTRYANWANCIGCSLEDAFPGLKQRGLLAAYDMVLSTGQPFTLSSRLHRYLLPLPADPESGLEYMPQAAIIAPRLDKTGIHGTLTFVLDVTERILTEQELRVEINKLNTLYEIDLALATLDLEACRSTLVENAQRLFQADGAALLVSLPVRLETIAGRLLEAPADPDGRAGLLARVHQQNRAEKIKTSGGGYAAMAAPLLFQGERLGVLLLERGGGRSFSQADLDLLEALAARAVSYLHNAQLHAQLQRANHQLEALINAVHLMSTHLSIEPLVDSIVTLVAQVFGVETVAYLSLNGQQNVFDLVSARPALPPPKPGLQLARSVVENLLRSVGTVGIVHLGRTGDLDGSLRQVLYALRQGQPCTHLLYNAITSHNNLSGVLLIPYEPRGQTFQADDLRVLKELGVQFGLALENASLYSNQKLLASTDALTGLGNRRSFDEDLKRNVERSQRLRQSLGLIILDIDHFKRFNDAFGHPAGDELLRALGYVIESNLRIGDRAYRYGGEEFAVLLPGANSSAALLVAERLRSCVQHGLVAHLSHSETLKTAPEMAWYDITISLGLAISAQCDGDLQALLRSADEALYRAKNAGRNQVCLSPDSL